ncbi:deleted in malignant brain tumors 1 protein-like [Pomacea canaliculata]|uniref:deleted in malignant brain tumors 1 protein-like n=1 Tax=Pomacea canaliculata TaxID=400727 RepID=UPI000D72A7D5|nr:deleted in malignant brain tumors 1 protein-like [Pomacea canaliculata]XP_025100701.1 deleted in malignant brain tumors 1 protein-like [Pomacea canaliculata]
MALVMLLLVSATICLTQTVSPSTSQSVSPSTSRSVCGAFHLFPSARQVNYLTSPNYPRSYENNVNCWRLISAPRGYVVRVTVLNATMEQGLDYVQLFDGSSAASPSLVRFSSMPSPTVYTSHGQSMYIKFYTDGSVVASGFRLSYEVVPVATPVCPVNPATLFAIAGHNRYLASPNYPSHYGNNLNCRWIVEAPPGHVVKVTVLDLSLQLNHDYVDLLNGISDSSPRLGRFYSMPPVDRYFSSERHMSIRFHTDGSVTNTGFRLVYRAVPVSARHG